MKTLLLGDSILCFMPQEILGTVDNKSSAGKYTWMVERDVPTYNIEMYDKIFLLIGINDFLNCDYTVPQKTSDSIISVINTIQSLKPKDLTVLGLLPVLEDDNLEEIEYCNVSIALINSKVKQYCDENSIRYLDCYSLFLDKKGKIDKTALLRDGLHPSDKGYRILTKAINEEIKQTKQLKEDILEK